WVMLAVCLLLACSDHQHKPLTAADLQGQYKFELSMAGEGNKPSTAVQDQDSLFTIGPNYIAFGDDRQQLDQISVREIDDEKYLVLKVADTEMSLKIIDKETLVLKKGPELGIFTRVK